ncbi:MAG TPA: hypothetical protein PKW98_19960 [Candidatus Wallbacteria bacterium]|nr:MAG: hypothetical protein BWY32_03005 [bacterium ADurb.Bin243]HOD39719.1 hypothetical protein [Candidatus Wallbacteria bacterium]HPG60104.1 hypothetical protein [Candidatus Wallbacteria bacterium]
MKSKAIIALCVVIFIFTIVIPGVRFILKSTSTKATQYSKKLKLEEELEQVRKSASRGAFNVQSFDPSSEYDQLFVAARKASEESRKSAQQYVEMNNKYVRATSGKASKMYILAEKFMVSGNFDRAADSLLAALKAEPDNQIMKLKIYQKLAMLGMIGGNEKTFIKALLRYVETCEGLDNDPGTKSEIMKVKLELQNKLAAAN